MFVDARTLPADAVLDADVCVVGAGPAGIALGLELMGTGSRILILDSGGVRPEVIHKLDDDGRRIGYPYHSLMFARARAFGGTSSRWHLHEEGDEGWMARPLDPIDFEERPGIPLSGWPFDSSHLQPYVDRAHALSDLGPATFAVEDWERPGMERLPLPEERIVTGVFQRGMTSFVRYHDRFATSGDVIVAVHATVLEVEASGEPGEVTRLLVATGPDRRFSVRAHIFVLAAGGIETPRLLLASRGHHPSGLGNGNDLVGRFFMEHLVGRIGYVRPAESAVLERCRLYESHRDGPVYVQAYLGLSAAKLRSEQLLNTAFFLLPRTEAFVSEGVRSLKALSVAVYWRPWIGGVTGHLRNVTTGLGPLTATVLGRLSRSAPSETVLAVRTQAEQAPNPASRITLDHRRDRFGTPRAVLDWRVSEFDLQSIRRSEDLLDQELMAAGLGHIERKLGEEDPPTVLEGGNHHMGTTRMHVDPREGVVDADGRVHGIRNLYITGSSVFPTGGNANPTLTVVALAIRLADHLKSRLGES